MRWAHDCTKAIDPALTESFREHNTRNKRAPSCGVKDNDIPLDRTTLI